MESRTGAASGAGGSQEIADCYMDFRLKRIQAETWVERSIRAWDEYTKAGGTGTMMELIHIHLLFSAGKEGGGLLPSGSDRAAENHLTAPEQQGYFLYLTTFIIRIKIYRLCGGKAGS